MTSAWERVAGWLASGRLPHAVLITGRAGLGKGLFAEALAAGLLCQSPSGPARACGQCRSCGLLAAGAHPDLVRAEPAEAGKPIKVDQVRAVVGALALRAGLGGRKVALLLPADAMNRHAANALLKTLEEPPGDTVLLLVSHAPGRLPATVLSRCQRLVIAPPAAGPGQAWLEAQLPGAGHARPAAARLLDLAGGAPLAALALARADGLESFSRVERDVAGILSGEVEPLEAADRWRASGVALACRWSYRVAGALLRAAYDPPGSGAGAPGAASGRLPVRLLVQVMDRAVDTLRAIEQGAPLNDQLAIDRLACAWAEVGHARGPSGAAPVTTLEQRP
jgi:DNA polymerase-3 subunit delta'